MLESQNDGKHEPTKSLVVEVGPVEEVRDLSVQANG